MADRTTDQTVGDLAWPADVRKFAQAVEAIDPDCYLDLCADIQRFLAPVGRLQEDE